MLGKLVLFLRSDAVVNVNDESGRISRLKRTWKNKWLATVCFLQKETALTIWSQQSQVCIFEFEYTFLGFCEGNKKISKNQMGSHRQKMQQTTPPRSHGN